MTYDFFASYPGPNGPHLSYLSLYTKTRREEDRLRGVSIHPRNWSGTPRSAGVVNTHKQPAPRTRDRLVNALTLHCERHPDDHQSVARLDALPA